MLVRQILKSKVTQDVVWVRPTDTVSAAARLMSENRIGTVIVSADGVALAGILSERDIVREVGRAGAACLDWTADRLMTSHLTTCTPTDSADRVLEMMTEGRFRHLPVLQDGTMIGLISIGDVVKARLSELSMEKSALEGMIMGH
ncbi:CBS domain-containing protein [Loktanella fryxellensis]|uniref:CBS domain-containing protein n=1 Tax=Loktanella fryxellensis TaxID=245187 RepID=A0A1H7YNH6_9RHOB|nr:CBS domain-containing protein [Loktanella fryxellensis]SEM47786.1 CBS domain-containing protein [Loktanella fryxellensis]